MYYLHCTLDNMLTLNVHVSILSVILFFKCIKLFDRCWKRTGTDMCWMWLVFDKPLTASGISTPLTGAHPHPPSCQACSSKEAQGPNRRPHNFGVGDAATIECNLSFEAYIIFYLVGLTFSIHLLLDFYVSVTQRIRKRQTSRSRSVRNSVKKKGRREKGERETYETESHIKSPSCT